MNIQQIQQIQYKFPQFTNDDSNQFILQTLCTLIKNTNADSIQRDELIKKIVSLVLSHKFVDETSYYNRYLVKKLIYFISFKN